MKRALGFTLPPAIEVDVDGLRPHRKGNDMTPFEFPPPDRLAGRHDKLDCLSADMSADLSAGARRAQEEASAQVEAKA